MNKDVRLLNEALDVLKKLRDWIPADYYRESIMPTVDRIKDRLAVIEIDMLKDSVSRAFNQNQSNENFEIDTIPDNLGEVSSQFGLFKSIDKDSK